jgi:aminopeptidase N
MPIQVHLQMQKIIALIVVALFGGVAQAQVNQYTVQDDASTHYCAAHKQQQAPQRKTRATSTGVYNMAKYDVSYYHLDISAETNTLYLAGSTEIAATALASIDSFCFELHDDYTIDSVKYNNTSLVHLHANNEAYAMLGTPIAAGAAFTITIYYHGTAPAGAGAAIGNAYSQANSPSWGNEVVWTLSQPYLAHEWFPCKQFLQDKADSSSVYITTSDSNMAGSNGTLRGVDLLPNNKKRYRWHNTDVIDYYLISFSISQYVDYSYYAKINNAQDSVLMQNFVYDNPGTLTYFKAQLDSVGLMLTYFDSLVSPYPFASQKYGHCQAPLNGGMEHQTMTTIGAFTFDVDAHELFHQWFGDHVTCRTWKDIWINEGFASYGEYLIRARFRNATSAANKMRSVHNNIKSQAGGSVYTNDTSNARIFDSRLSYNKGSAVIHNLRFVLGDSAFFKTLNTFMNQYGNGNAETAEFKTLAETVSGINLTAFFNQWIYGEGYPTYTGSYNSNGSTIIVKLNHTTSTAVTPLFTGPLELKLKSIAGDTIVRVDVQSNSDVFIFNSSKAITAVEVDPNNWVIDSAKVFVKDETLFPTGIALSGSEGVNLLPNPAANIVFITGANAISAQVYNMAGQLQKAQFSNSSINTQYLAAGLYTVRVTCLDGAVYSKVLEVKR